MKTLENSRKRPRSSCEGGEIEDTVDLHVNKPDETTNTSKTSPSASPTTHPSTPIDVDETKPMLIPQHIPVPTTTANNKEGSPTTENRGRESTGEPKRKRRKRSVERKEKQKVYESVIKKVIWTPVVPSPKPGAVNRPGNTGDPGSVRGFPQRPQQFYSPQYHHQPYPQHQQMARKNPYPPHQFPRNHPHQQSHLDAASYDPNNSHDMRFADMPPYSQEHQHQHHNSLSQQQFLTQYYEELQQQHYILNQQYQEYQNLLSEQHDMQLPHQILQVQNQRAQLHKIILDTYEQIENQHRDLEMRKQLQLQPKLQHLHQQQQYLQQLQQQQMEKQQWLQQEINKQININSPDYQKQIQQHHQCYQYQYKRQSNDQRNSPERAADLLHNNREETSSQQPEGRSPLFDDREGHVAKNQNQQHATLEQFSALATLPALDFPRKPQLAIALPVNEEDGLPTVVGTCNPEDLLQQLKNLQQQQLQIQQLLLEHQTQPTPTLVQQPQPTNPIQPEQQPACQLPQSQQAQQTGFLLPPLSALFHRRIGGFQ